MSASQYLAQAEAAAALIRAVLSENAGTEAGLISRYRLVELHNGAVLLVVSLDDRRLPRFEPYIQAAHRLDTSLKGSRLAQAVAMSNSTGLRYVAVLAGLPELPASVPFPAVIPGQVQLGQGIGQFVTSTWEALGHMLVAGMTGYGKSNFLRLLAMQASADGVVLNVIDPDGRTFPQAAQPSNPTEAARLSVLAAKTELARRVQLYNALPGAHDSLEGYNAAARAAQSVQGPTLAPLLPLYLLIVDEFNGLVLASGGPRGELAQTATELAWSGRKFGMTIVLAGQTFEKAVVGPVRDQMATRICFRVANRSVSHIVLNESGAERLCVPGRALAFPFGLFQAYFVEKGAVRNLALPVVETPQAGEQEPGAYKATLELAEKIRAAWEVGASKRAMARLAGGEYAGAFAARIDKAIACLEKEHEKSATTTLPRDDQNPIATNSPAVISASSSSSA